ncbi:putative Transcriptional regulator, AraC family [Candidatus Sulfopaludibacter sp. SbA4]|nr:putative Transcriptional regulator, AraC family [Candidatus Sulfopaludibacter sp. SbA4]
MTKRPNNHYHDRVNRVLDYIGRHLDDDLSLSRLSEVGCFSAFHFHRIFQTVTGETLNSHVRRVRLERAALLMKTSPRKRITDVAMEAGFAGTAEFSRAFRNHFGRAPSSWDRRSPLEKSKICKAPEMLSFYSLEELETWKANANVRVRLGRFSAFRYVYIRVFAPYGNTRLVDAYHALIRWLADRRTDVRDVVFIGMSLDDPAVTPSENCRYDLGVAFPEQTGPKQAGPKQSGAGLLGEIIRSRGHQSVAVPHPDASECCPRGFSIRDLESQEIAAVHCAGDLGYVDRAWHYLYRIWLPSVAFEPADLPAMEVFVRLPEEIGWQTFDLQACIPVARL